MEEGRVPDDADDASLFTGLVDSLGDGKTASHAEDRVRPRKGREDGEAIAADVPGDEDVVFREREKESAVRAAGAEDRRAGG
jgi:hypothetical protein